MFGHNGKLYEFSSGNIEKILMKYTEHDGESERRGPKDFNDEGNLECDNDHDNEFDNNSDNDQSYIEEEKKPRIDINDTNDDQVTKSKTNSPLSQSKPQSQQPSQHGQQQSQSLSQQPQQTSSYLSINTNVNPRTPKPLSPFDPNKYTPYPPPFYLPYSHSPNSTVQHENQPLGNWHFGHIQAQAQAQAQMHAQVQSQQMQQQTQTTDSNQNSRHSNNYLSAPPTTPVIPPPPQPHPAVIHSPNPPWFSSIPPLAWPPPNALSSSILLDPFNFPLDPISSPSDGQSSFQWPIAPPKSQSPNPQTTHRNTNEMNSAGSENNHSNSNIIPNDNSNESNTNNNGNHTLQVPSVGISIKEEPSSPRSGKRPRLSE